MDRRVSLTFCTLAVCLTLAACWSCGNSSKVESKAPAVSAPPAVETPSGPIPARSAFFEMYKPARQWATDVMPLLVTSGEIPEMKNEGGKAGLWTAIFVSASKRQARTFTYAAANSGSDIRKGVGIGRVQDWGGPSRKSKPFSSGELTIDSDAAYAVAAKKAEVWLKKNPNKKLAIYLASEARFTEPAWYFMWGDKKSGYVAFISATTGQPLTGK
jgi:hypothetical protein